MGDPFACTLQSSLKKKRRKRRRASIMTAEEDLDMSPWAKYIIYKSEAMTPKRE